MYVTRGHHISVTATPAAPTPMTSTRDRLERTSRQLRGVEHRCEHDDRGAVLVVVEDRDLELALQLGSIAKQRGAEMSSRLIPPNAGAIILTALMISSGSLLSSAIGNASMPANSLNRQHLPSITGIAAWAPMFPRPSTALPSVTTATVLRLIVYS